MPLFIQLYAKPKNRGWRGVRAASGQIPGASFSKAAHTNIVRSDVVRVLDEIVAGTPYRANRALAALKKLMNWALDRGMIESQPYPRV